MMKKNWMVFPVILFVLAGIACITVLSCGGNDGPSVPSEETYTGTDTDGVNYTLKIKDSSTFELIIDGESVSTGTAKKEGDTWVLTPYQEGDPLIVTVSGNKIKGFEGLITPDSGEPPFKPGTIVEVEPVAGVWTWALSDDSQLNPHVTPQTIFSPGGASRFADGSYVEDAEETDRYDKPVKRPFKYTAGTVLDNDGNVINADVFNFKGNVTVSSANRPANQGAGFPVIGWEAIPDEATLELLRTAYGYSFWVRLNSSTASNWAFVTAIVTDYEEEKGYEHKHWFGNQAGDSGGLGVNNLTSKLTVGTWYQITVVLDKTSSGFNITQDKWMPSFIPASPTIDKDIRDKAALDHPYDQSVAQKLQWQIPLQHQVGAGVQMRGGPTYDALTGSYDFDLDFYGLELNM